MSQSKIENLKNVSLDVNYKVRLQGPPGTGKTTSMLKIVDMYLSKGVAANDILFVGFTKKSAEEAKDRVSNKQVICKTLHSFCFGYQTGYKKIISFKQKIDFCKSTEVEEFKRNYGLRFDALKINTDEDSSNGDNLWDQLDKARNTFDFGNNNVLKEFYALYNDFLESNDLIDFTRMLENFLVADPKTIKDFKVVIVDEAQDLTKLQWKCVDKLNTKHLYIAGDDDQGIYQFSGADIEYFANREVDEEIVLDKSYRLPSAVHKYVLKIRETIPNHKEKEYAPVREGWHCYPTCNFLEADGIKDRPLWDFSKFHLTNGESWLFTSFTKAMAKRMAESLLTIGIFPVDATGKPIMPTDMVAKWELANESYRNQLMNYDGHESALNNVKFYFKCIKARIDRGITDMTPDKVTVANAHKVKGGTWQNVYVRYEYNKFGTDTQTRLFYVAASRASNRLFVDKGRVNEVNSEDILGNLIDYQPSELHALPDEPSSNKLTQMAALAQIKYQEKYADIDVLLDELTTIEKDTAYDIEEGEIFTQDLEDILVNHMMNKMNL